MSPIAVLAAVLATMIASGAALSVAHWLLVRAAEQRALDALARDWRHLDRERQRAIGALMRGRLRAARLAHPRVTPRRSERVAVEAERHARR